MHDKDASFKYQYFFQGERIEKGQARITPCQLLRLRPRKNRLRSKLKLKAGRLAQGPKVPSQDLLEFNKSELIVIIFKFIHLQKISFF